MAKDINNIIYKVQVDATSGKISIDGVTKSFEQADKAFLKLQKDVAKGIPNATKSVKNLGDATGSATSATMELSRVISDAPYGIRGMANNITQLVSQLGTASTKAGGLSAALKLMGKQLLGPLGFVFAITAAVSALDFFFGANKKAEESMDSFRVTASKAAADLKSLLVVVKEDMLSKEDLAVVVDKVNKKYKDLNLSIDEEGRLTKESRIQIDKKIKSMGNLALANAMMAEIEKKQSEIAKAAVEMQEDTSKDLEKLGVKDLETFKQRQDETEKAYIKRMNALGEHQKGYYKGEIDVDRVNRIARVRRQVASFEETKKRVQEQTKELLKISTTEGFFDRVFDSTDKKSGTKSKKISPFKTPEELELEVKSNISAIDKLTKQTELINLKSEEKSRLATAQSEEDKIFIKEEYALKKLDIDEKYEKKAMEAKKLAEIQSATESNIAYQRKIDKDLAAFEAKLRKEGKALTDAEAKMLQDAKKVASDKKESANQELMDTVVNIEEQYSKLFPFWEQMAAARRAAIGTGKKIDTDNEFTLEEGIQQFMKAQSAMTEFLDGEYQRQVTIEQNKTNSINNELRERLNNENLASGERKRIQLQIARNDEALRKKQEQIEKKRFKLNKAANIAQATISTYLAANKVLAETKGGTIARFVAMAATISSGLLNVAAIARQKFQSSAGATTPAGALGGGGSGGGNDRSFNFNLAGASRENQLAQTLQGRFDQPLQAYVVSRDITNQQQLDEEITSSASFG